MTPEHAFKAMFCCPFLAHALGVPLQQGCRSTIPFHRIKTPSEKYGETEVEKLGEKYGLGDSPIISGDDLTSEWLNFRIYLLSNCGKMSMKDLLSLLATQNSTVSTVYPNLSKLAQIFWALPIGTADCEWILHNEKDLNSFTKPDVKCNFEPYLWKGKPLIHGHC